ncbi:carbohydrate ABC transporter permease [Roseomonas sp. OT10]|uniref:carbohydrate ABC transporter permease n=1 Tax=Roseomonas cutis TaxID=2897332 RepID=UPI001E52932F|nr:carbohydrate ABC transporter permease [Roseomonas sp. OT10]UFN48002.1 carbohydrate ABC transporter permease [Roseomonas sp. OT10]
MTTLDLSSPRAKLGFALVALAIGGFLFLPMLWLVLTSLKPEAEIFVQRPSLLPQSPTLLNYARALTRSELPRQLWNSLVTAGGGALLTTALAAMAGYSFAKFRYRGRRALMLLMIAAQMFPFAVLLLSLHPLLQRAGLLDTRLGLVLSYVVFALPPGIYMLYSNFAAIPDDILEAARADGAGEWLILRRIVLPLSIPGLVTVGLYAFMWAWNDLLYALTLITDPALRTVGPGLLLGYLGEARSDWGGAMAASLLASLPVVVAFGFVQRFFVQGLTAGAVKG